MKTALQLLIYALIMLLPTQLLAAKSPVKAGVKALEQKHYEQAITHFSQALQKKQRSATIHANLATAQYRFTDYENAANSYENAARLAQSPPLRARCLYNQANSLVQTAQKLEADEPKQALLLYQHAAKTYRNSLALVPSNNDAGYNLEITQRLTARTQKTITDEADKQEKEDQLLLYIRKKLEEFIERQTQLIETQNTGTPQQMLQAETSKLATTIQDSGLHATLAIAPDKEIPGPLTKTYTHTQNAVEAMAKLNQALALNQLKAALEAAPVPPEQEEGESDDDSDDFDEYDMEYDDSDPNAESFKEADPFGDFSEYEEIRGVPPPNQTETDILAEEIRNQERRKQKKSGKYKPTDRDW